jgi:hypothetical protein
MKPVKMKVIISKARFTIRFAHPQSLHADMQILQLDHCSLIVHLAATLVHPNNQL